MVRARALLLALCFGAAAARAASDFAIEAELSPGAVYVGSEAILRLRLLRGPGVPYGVLRPPALGDAAEVWPLERVRWYETTREGVPWQVHERTYLILPRRAGRIEIPGAELEGPLRHVLTKEKRPPWPARSLRGVPIRLEVRPAPDGANEPWLPARSVTLEESWSHDPATLTVGTPVTRTVIVRAEGLPARRLPVLLRFDDQALRLHHDQPEYRTEHRASGTVSRMSQRVVLVALDEGEVVLPAVNVHWWDVAADLPRVATLGARTLRLQIPAAEDAVEPAASQPDSPARSERAAAAAFGLLLAAWLWWHARTHARRDARRKLRQACLANDAPAARDALAEWWTATRKGSPLPLLSAMGEGWSAEARAALRSLDAALYGKRAWEGAKFWRSVRRCLRRKPGRGAGPARESFFRLQG